MLKAWQYLQALSALPPRGSGTVGERRTAAWRGERLSEMGYEVEKQVFRSPVYTLYLGPLLVIAGLLIATWALGRWPGPAALLGLLLLVPLVGEMLGAKVNLNYLPLPRRRSQNVVARFPHGARKGQGSTDPGGEAASERKPIPVVIVAHYDTQWGTWLFHPRFRPFLRPFFYCVYGGLGLNVAGLFVRWLFPGFGWGGTLLTVSAVILTLAGFFLAVAVATGRAVPGANDNGSGVAVALALADRWRTEGPAELEPVFVFTGCEEVGLRGMRHFLATTLPPSNTIFVNLDNVGGGRLRYLLGEGMLTYQRYDADLIELAEQLTERYPGKVEPLRNLLLPTDGLLAAKAGYKAITLLAAGDRGVIPNYHWHTDTLEHVDRNVLAVTERFTVDLLKGLAEAVRAGKFRWLSHA
ncbi:MAG: M28 family peptidase [Firmicutes bacterium]|nr:M28 family peptidase [Bacillota bacterium]